MPRKGMRSIFFHASPASPLSPKAHPPPSSPARTFRATLMEDNVNRAEAIITKWDPDGSAYAKITSIFYESRDEARRFLRAVGDLQQAMQFFAVDSPVSSSHLLVRSQHLMQAAMRRLQKEFYQILSANRDRLDGDSLSSARSSLSTAASFSDLEEDYYGTAGDPNSSEDDEIRAAGDSIAEVERLPTAAMNDLRSIAECMISSGYAKECVKIYKLIRRSIVDEGIFRLGFERLSPSQVHKLSWDSLELRIKTWLAASRVAVKTLFSGERVLCDYVFSPSPSIKESCFAEITRDPAVVFLGFPELAVKAKRTPDKTYYFLDLYHSISELWPEIESVFSYQSTSAVRSQALSSLLKLGDCIRSMVADFESGIQKDSSKATVPGGGIHPITLHGMNYLVFLADYGGALGDIFADYPLPARTSPLPESFLSFLNTTSAPPSPSVFETEEETVGAPSSISSRLAWLLLVLLCKLDAKAEYYKDAALSYLFLANNLQYILNKVRASNLSLLLGDGWAAQHEEKARSFARSFERIGWTKVADLIPDDPAAMLEAKGLAAAKERMRQFNKAFEAACRVQAGWVVTDGTMRNDVRVSIARKVVVPYRAFYERCRAVMAAESESAAVVRFAPEGLKNHLANLFEWNGGSSVSGSSTAGSVVSGSGSSKLSRWRNI